MQYVTGCHMLLRARKVGKAMVQNRHIGARWKILRRTIPAAHIFWEILALSLSHASAWMLCIR
jgi:hypothetical protein